MEEFSWQALLRQLEDLWARLREGLPEPWWSGEGAREIVRLTRPVDPFNSSDFLAPVIGLAGLLAGVLLTGVALASLGTLLASMLALGFLLTEVYGITLEVEGMPPPPSYA